ncbi:MAG TPA: transporter [Nitrospiraceae bacterium]|nr:transporter [Nitrospiraceae bacterium]
MSLFLLAGLCVAATPTPGAAQVQLPMVNLGDTNFEDGFAAPGWFLQEFPSGYTAGELKDSNGKTVPGSNRVTAYSTTTHVAFISKKRFLGGWLMGEVLIPLVDLDVQLASGTEARVRGFADLTVGPGLQWPSKKIGNGVFVQRAMIDVGVPTGKYSNTRAVNIGNHFVVVNPYYCFTYERKKVEFSARLHYLWNSANNDPFVGSGIKSMQPGQAFHMNYATSYPLFNNVRLGFNGYWLQQLTNHEIKGVAVPNSKERTVGLGPGIQLGGRGIWFRVNSYMETNVRNRPSGIKVMFRISKALPTRESQP